MKTRMAICSALLLNACSTNPLTISLSELGTATKSDIGSSGLRLNRSVNVTGMGATEIVGSYTIDPDPDLFIIPVPWGTKNIPDTLYPRIIPGCNTLVVETKFPDASHDDVIAVRDNLFKLDELQLQELNYQVIQTALEGIKSTLTSEVDKTIKSANDSQVTDEASLENRIKSLTNERPTDDAQLRKNKQELDNLEKKKQELGNLKTTWLNQAKTITGLQEMSSIDDEIVNKVAQIKIVEELISKKKDALENALKTPSIVVTNWSRTEDVQANASAADGGMSAGMQKKKQLTGYLVLGSPRVTSLIIGNDLLAKANKQKSGSDGDLSYLEDADRLYITQYALSAKELAWSESRSGTFEARAKIQIDKVINTLSQVPANLNSVKDKLNALKVEVGFGLATAYSASSSGALGAAKSAIYRFDFLDGYKNAYLAELSRASSYRNVYTSRGTFAALVIKDKKYTKGGEACHGVAQKTDFSYFEENILDSGIGVDLVSEFFSTKARVSSNQDKAYKKISSLPKNGAGNKAMLIVKEKLVSATQSAIDAIDNCASSVTKANSNLIQARSNYISQVDDDGRSKSRGGLDKARKDVEVISNKIGELENSTIGWLGEVIENAMNDETLKSNFDEKDFRNLLGNIISQHPIKQLSTCAKIE